MVEIVDRESAQKWLFEAPRKAQIAFATRSALRVLPALSFAPSALPHAALPTFRAALVCYVASEYPDSEPLRAAASDALSALDADGASGEAIVRFAFSRALATVKRQDVSYDTAGALIRTPDETAADAMEASTHVDHKAATMAAGFDASILSGSGTRELFRLPLWTQRNHEHGSQGIAPDAYAEANEAFEEFLASDPVAWGFWLRWHRGLLYGEPLDLEFQREVALIPDDDWKQGPEHIARLIEEIEARFALKARIRELEEELARASGDRLGIGGNNPPEAIEDAPSVAKELAIIWAPLQDLKSEVESGAPDPSRIARLLTLLSEALRHGLGWCASKADLIIDTSIKWAIPWAGGYFALNPDKLAAVIEAGKRWLSTLP